MSPAISILGTARTCVGALSLLAPVTAAPLFGIGPSTTPFVSRLFGSRELALAGALLAAQGDDVRRLALLGAAIDGVDAVSAAVELRRGRLSTYGAVFGGVGAATFAVLGLLVARQSGARD